MELDWSTFALEIVNFLVLVWILKRFFYQPVRQAIDSRRQRIEKEMADAKAAQAEAGALKAQYEKRQVEWEAERQDARRKLQADMAEERQKQMDALKKSLDEERQKNKALDARKQAEALRETESVAMRQAAQFAAKLLQGAAGPELDARLAAAFAEEVKNLPEDRRAELQKACAGATAIKVASAFPLDRKQQDGVTSALAALAGKAVSCDFTVDASVIAGVRASMGSYVLEASIGDELRFFADAAREAA